jgi:hypothetical protein
MYEQLRLYLDKEGFKVTAANLQKYTENSKRVSAACRNQETEADTGHSVPKQPGRDHL